VNSFTNIQRHGPFATVLADPPWRFMNSTGKVAPEHARLFRYETMSLDEICALPVADLAAPTAHLYLWCPNALLREGLTVMEAWGFTYKTNIVWHKIRRDGGSDGRGVGFYFRNVTELVLFGVRGRNARTLAPGRRQVNFIESRKREHSRKPDELYEVIEACSRGPYLELFARSRRPGWVCWGDEVGIHSTRCLCTFALQPVPTRTKPAPRFPSLSSPNQSTPHDFVFGHLLTVYQAMPRQTPAARAAPSRTDFVLVIHANATPSLPHHADAMPREPHRTISFGCFPHRASALRSSLPQPSPVQTTPHDYFGHFSLPTPALQPYPAQTTPLLSSPNRTILVCCFHPPNRPEPALRTPLRTISFWHQTTSHHTAHDDLN
jgi:N6-adenosine-specific RNA methylase IME4